MALGTPGHPNVRSAQVTFPAAPTSQRNSSLENPASVYPPNKCSAPVASVQLAAWPKRSPGASAPYSASWRQVAVAKWKAHMSPRKTCPERPPYTTM